MLSTLIWVIGCIGQTGSILIHHASKNSKQFPYGHSERNIEKNLIMLTLIMVIFFVVMKMLFA